MKIYKTKNDEIFKKGANTPVFVLVKTQNTSIGRLETWIAEMNNCSILRFQDLVLDEDGNVVDANADYVVLPNTHFMFNQNTGTATVFVENEETGPIKELVKNGDVVFEHFTEFNNLEKQEQEQEETEEDTPEVDESQFIPEPESDPESEDEDGADEGEEEPEPEELESEEPEPEEEENEDGYEPVEHVPDPHAIDPESDLAKEFKRQTKEALDRYERDNQQKFRPRKKDKKHKKFRKEDDDFENENQSDFANQLNKWKEKNDVLPENPPEQREVQASKTKVEPKQPVQNQQHQGKKDNKKGGKFNGIVLPPAISSGRVGRLYDKLKN